MMTMTCVAWFVKKPWPFSIVWNYLQLWTSENGAIVISKATIACASRVYLLRTATLAT